VRTKFVGFLLKENDEVKSYDKMLSTPVSSHFPWKSIWKVKAP
jgi:hypothetical protein